MILPLALAFGAPFDPASVKRDAKVAYGFGSGKTVQEAQEIAFNEVIADALAGLRSAKPEGDGKIHIDKELAKVFKLDDLKPFLNQKDEGVVWVGYRINRADFAKTEAPREADLRADLAPQFKVIAGNTDKSLQDRMVEAGYLLNRLYEEGVYDVLSASPNGSTLLSKDIEKFYSGLVSGLKVAISQDSGLIYSTAAIGITVTLKDKPVAALPVALRWSNGKRELLLSAVTDDQGKAALAMPADKDFLNRKLTLKIGTGFSVKVPESAFLVAVDKSFTRELAFRQTEDAGKIAANEVSIAGGAFSAGAVKQDRRASANTEKPRQVNLADFAIDRYPVTNALWAAYIDDAKIPEDQWPEYWDNSDFNKPNQPVVGVSYEEVVKFAKWLSSRLGYTKRLPTEDEYERAARGDLAVVYPWGDQPATDGKRANYNKADKYESTSPVGSFENGKTASGLYDMSGNVWEWTSTGPDANMMDDPSWKLVKGGSWMDGPNELRISNRRALDPAQRYQDVGFRLVREVK